MNSALIAFGAILALGSPALADPKPISCAPDLAWNEEIDFDKVAETLRTGKIVKIENLKQFLKDQHKHAGGSSEPLLLTYENGVRGVYKPDLHESAVAEKDAYTVDRRHLHTKMVPPTVIRNLEGHGVGSIQYFISTTVDWANQFDRKNIGVSEEEFVKRDMYYFVFGQWDRHFGNVMADETGHLALIDNTAIRTRQKVRYGEHPFLAKFHTLPSYHFDSPAKFPFDNFVELLQPEPDDLRRFFHGKLPSSTIEYHMKYWERDRKAGRKSQFNLRVVFWDHHAWIQTTPVGEVFEPIHFNFLMRDLLETYRQLTFDGLRETFDQSVFPDVKIREMLERRDQLLEIAKTVPLK